MKLRYWKILRLIVNKLFSNQYSFTLASLFYSSRAHFVSLFPVAIRFCITFGLRKLFRRKSTIHWLHNRYQYT